MTEEEVKNQASAYGKQVAEIDDLEYISEENRQKRIDLRREWRAFRLSVPAQHRVTAMNSYYGAYCAV